MNTESNRLEEGFEYSFKNVIIYILTLNRRFYNEEKMNFKTKIRKS